MEFISKSVEDTKKIAFDFARDLLERCQRAPSTSLRGATVIGLYGELGSGKTTFMKYLAKSLDVKETIQSPTFVIMKKYKIRSMNYELRSMNKKVQKNLHPVHTDFLDSLYHIDAYRIEKEEEVLNLGWQEIINNPKNIVCIEWPERISLIMPKHIMLRFEYGERENERKIKIASSLNRGLGSRIMTMKRFLEWIKIIGSGSFRELKIALDKAILK